MLWLALVGCGAPALPETEWVDVPPTPVRDVALEGVDDRDLVGHWTVVVIGYLTCPDVCPTALRGLSEVAGEEDVEVWFVSIDPDRDRGRLADVRWYHESIRGLTGTREALDELVATLGLAYAPDGTSWEHSTSAAVVDPEANVVGYALQPGNGASMRRVLDRVRRAHEPHADLWTAEGPPTAEMWAIYGRLSADVLGVEARGYEEAHLHQTVVRDGRARMETRSSLPRGSVLEPGGTHLMIGGGSAPDDSVLVDLRLADRQVLVAAPVR